MPIRFTSHFHTRFMERIRNRKWLCVGTYYSQLSDIENVLARYLKSFKNKGVEIMELKVDISNIIRVVGCFEDQGFVVKTVYVK